MMRGFESGQSQNLYNLLQDAFTGKLQAPAPQQKMQQVPLQKMQQDV